MFPSKCFELRECEKEHRFTHLQSLVKKKRLLIITNRSAPIDPPTHPFITTLQVGFFYHDNCFLVVFGLFYCLTNRHLIEYFLKKLFFSFWTGEWAQIWEMFIITCDENKNVGLQNIFYFWMLNAICEFFKKKKCNRQKKTASTSHPCQKIIISFKFAIGHL